MTQSTPPYSASFGYSLAMRVLQSSLYAQLHADEKRECDELIRRGQAPARGADALAPTERELFEAEWLRLGKEVERAPVEWGNGPNAYMWADTADAWRLWDTAFQAGRASRAQEAPALGYEKMRGGLPVAHWRDDALEQSAQIAERYGADPWAARDIRAMKSALPAAPEQHGPLTDCDME